jgi:dolichyl-phosphate mannosyltransferase polypeptide 3
MPTFQMTTQLQKYLTLASPVVALWILIFANIVQLSAGNRTFLLYYAPFFGVFAFGLYAVYTVANGAVSIEDCVKAREELRMEMDEAKRELKARGIID